MTLKMICGISDETETIGYSLLTGTCLKEEGGHINLKILIYSDSMIQKQ